MTARTFGALACALVLCASAWAEDEVGPVPAALRAELELSPLYEQAVLVDTFPIVASARVSPYALREAAYLVRRMTAGRPGLLPALRRRRVRLVVMAHDQLTTQVPEHSDLTPAKFWDRRARGLGASDARPAVSCGEENLLGFPGDPYFAENVLIHEFAHALDLMALRELVPGFADRLLACYEAAMAAGRWAGTYAAENEKEYWAEGVQSWFGTNRSDDALHNHVDTRAELETYDPALAALIAEALGRDDWRYVHPTRRVEPGHLRGFDRARSPTFAWPAELEAWYQAYTRGNPSGRINLPAVPPAPSGEAGAGTRILFVNHTPWPLTVAWIAPDGERRPYHTLAPGRQVEQTTWTGHVWVVVDPTGAEVRAVRAEPGLGRVELLGH